MVTKYFYKNCVGDWEHIATAATRDFKKITKIKEGIFKGIRQEYSGHNGDPYDETVMLFDCTERLDLYYAKIDKKMLKADLQEIEEVIAEYKEKLKKV